jgi:hypothetical protein
MTQIHQDAYQRELPATRAREIRGFRRASLAAWAATLSIAVIAALFTVLPRTHRA